MTSAGKFYDFFILTVTSFNYFTVGYFIVVNMIYIVILVTAFFSIKKHIKLSRLVQLKKIFRSPFFKPITIIVPAYNEEATIVESLESLLQIQYPLFEIIVVDDGSKDRTFLNVAEHFEIKRSEKVFRKLLPCAEVRGIYTTSKHPNLIVLDKANGGKADAINAGINASNYPLFCAIDADSVLESDVLMRIIRPFIEDSKTVAAGGTIRISNGCSIKNGFVRSIGLPKSFLGKFQILEYLRAFLIGRVAFSSIDGLLIVSGAFGIFKKETVVQVGGYNTQTIGEDMELIVRMHKVLREKKVPYKIVFIPEPVCWTEAPEDLKVLGHQRKRWQRGLLESLMSNRSMFLNSKFGSIGFLAFPFYLIVEGLGCVIELFGVSVFLTTLFFGLVDRDLAILFLFGGVILNIWISLGAILFEELTLKRYPRLSDILKLSYLSLFEIFAYRPFTVWWRLSGTLQFLLGTKQRWGDMKRQGFDS